MTLWALEKDGARVEDMKLVVGHPILSGYAAAGGNVGVVESPKWSARKGAY